MMMMMITTKKVEEERLKDGKINKMKVGQKRQKRMKTEDRERR
jgi:hypothetical protein